MKRLVIAFIAVGTTLCSCSQKSKFASKVDLVSHDDTVSYCLGSMEAKGLMSVMARMPFDTVDFKILAKSFDASVLNEQYLQQRTAQFDTIMLDAFRAGFAHQLTYGRIKIDEPIAEAIVNGKYEEVRHKRDAERHALAEANQAKGEAFLAENAKKDGVVALESGLQYKVLTAGKGAKPGDNDRVKVHYTGRLLDGTVFDSSVERGEPFTCSTHGGVIKGWLEVLKLMPVGSKWEVYIPAELAYGERGGGDKIGPNETLIFEIELLEIIDNAKK